MQKRLRYPYDSPTIVMRMERKGTDDTIPRREKEYARRACSTSKGLKFMIDGNQATTHRDFKERERGEASKRRETLLTRNAFRSGGDGTILRPRINFNYDLISYVKYGITRAKK
jgi:hypothetical protein